MPITTIPQDTQARRVRLLSRLERRMGRAGLALERLARMRTLLRPLLTRLRCGEDPVVIAAELRRMGWRK